MKRNPLRSKIPPAIRNVLAEDPFMSECYIGGDCAGKIEWNHAMTYGGKRVNELYAIIPVCKHHHNLIAKYQPEMKQAITDRIYFFDAQWEFRKKYPRSQLI